MRRRLTRTGRGTALFAVPLLIIAVLGNALASPADLRVIVNFMITLVLVLAIQSFSGNSGIVSFGHVGFMGVGAYVAAMVTIPPAIKEGLMPSLPGFIADNSVPFVPAVLLGAAAGAIVASVIGLALTRMHENAMAMATIGVLVILFVVFDNWEGLTRGATGLFGIPRSTTVWSALVFAVITIAICRFYRESNPGLELRASRTDSLAAEALGSNVVRLRWWAWTLSGRADGDGRRDSGPSTTSRSAPSSSSSHSPSGFSRSSSSAASASVSGAVIGAVVVTAVFEIMRRIEDNIDVPGITQIVVALVILLVLYRRPNGLMGLSEADDVLARRFSRARRRGTQAPPG